MRTEDFVSTLKKMHLKLDFFFHKKLREVNKFRDLETTKKSLIHETSIKAWMRFQKADPSSYTIETIIFLAANDTWSTFIKPRKKERHVYFEPEEMNALSGSEDMQPRLEAIDYLSVLESTLDNHAWEMISIRAHGYTFKEISEQLNMPETTVKDKLQKHYKNLNERIIPKPPPPDLPLQAE